MEEQSKIQQTKESLQTVRSVWIVLVCLALIGVTCVLLEKAYPQYSGQTGIPLEDISSRNLDNDSINSRVTHILLCDESGASCGIMVGSVKFQGAISGTTGDKTVKIAKLEDGLMTLEADGGAWKFSTDGGSTYKVIADTETIATNFLALDNTTAFTPDSDYEPATKKYVDDNAGGSGGTTSEYALVGDGTGNLATVTTTSTSMFTGNDLFSLWGVVLVNQLTRAESFFKVTETGYSENVLNFGKTSDDRLELTIGANTYTSEVVWDADTRGIPVEVGVTCNKTGSTVVFWFAGAAEAEQAAVFTFPTVGGNEIYTLGDGLDGGIFFWSAVKTAPIAQNTYHTPFTEGLASAQKWLLHYNMGATTGATLYDRFAEQSGGTALDMAVNGTWTEFTQGY